MNAAAENIFIPPAPPAPPSTGDSGGGGEGDAVNLREAIQRAQIAAGITPIKLGDASEWARVVSSMRSVEFRAWYALNIPHDLLLLDVEDLARIAAHFGRNL